MMGRWRNVEEWIITFKRQIPIPGVSPCKALMDLKKTKEILVYNSPQHLGYINRSIFIKPIILFFWLTMDKYERNVLNIYSSGLGQKHNSSLG